VSPASYAAGAGQEEPREFQGQTDFAEDSMLGSILNFEDLAEKLQEISPLLPMHEINRLRELLP
jgi:hypothetical protein